MSATAPATLDSQKSLFFYSSFSNNYLDPTTIKLKKIVNKSFEILIKIPIIDLLFPPIYRFKKSFIINDDFLKEGFVKNLFSKIQKDNFTDKDLQLVSDCYYKSSNQINNLYKKLLKEYNLDPKNIHFITDFHLGSDAFTHIDIKGLSNSILFLGFNFIFPCSLNDKCLKQTEFVLAHEISHIKNKHYLKGLAFAVFICSSAILFSFFMPLYLAQLATSYTFFSLLSNFKIPLLFLNLLLEIYLPFKYMKNQEKEADLDALKKVGSKGAIDLFEKLLKENIEYRKEVLENGSWYRKLLTRLAISSSGNDNFDIYHPKITDRIKYFKDFQKKYNK
jgi:hypothetical protein